MDLFGGIAVFLGGEGEILLLRDTMVFHISFVESITGIVSLKTFTVSF